MRHDDRLGSGGPDHYRSARGRRQRERAVSSDHRRGSRGSSRRSCRRSSGALAKPARPASARKRAGHAPGIARGAPRASPRRRAARRRCRRPARARRSSRTPRGSRGGARRRGPSARARSGAADVASSRSTSRAWRPVVGSSKRKSVPREVGGPDSEERGELQPLRLAARQRRGGLAQPHVAEAGLAQRLEAADDLLLGRRRSAAASSTVISSTSSMFLPRSAHARGRAPGTAGRRRRRSARSRPPGTACRSSASPCPGTPRSGPPTELKEKSRARDPARDGARRPREELPDLVPGLRVGDGVRARRAAERDSGPRAGGRRSLSKPVDAVVRADVELRRALDAPRVGVVQDVAHERGLAGARDARDGDEAPERKPDRQVLEVVLRARRRS